MPEITLKISNEGDAKTIAESLRATHVEWLAEIVEDQLPRSVVGEPTQFGSIVRAGRGGSDRVLWTQLPHLRRHYWLSETGIEEVWSELTDVEVLRIGLGESSDLEKVREEAWNDGARELAAQVHVKLRALLADAISAERKNAYEKAMQAVEEVTP